MLKDELGLLPPETTQLPSGTQVWNNEVRQVASPHGPEGGTPASPLYPPAATGTGGVAGGDNTGGSTGASNADPSQVFDYIMSQFTITKFTITDIGGPANTDTDTATDATTDNT